MPPLPELASELFGETGWLRRLIAATSDGDVVKADLADAAAAEGDWNRRVAELLGRLIRLEAVAADLKADPGQEYERMALRAEIDIAAAAVRAVSQHDARSFLAGVGLLGAAVPPVDESSPGPTPADRILAMMGGWGEEEDGDVLEEGLRIRGADGSATRWQVVARTGGLGLRRLDGAPTEVAVFLDDYGEHAAPSCLRLAEDVAERAGLWAGGTVVLQVAAGAQDEGAPYEEEAQAAARRGYKILGGDPDELPGMIWGGGTRTVRAFLADPDLSR